MNTKNQLVKNEGYERTVALLRQKGYECIREFEAKSPLGCLVCEDRFEMWLWIPEDGGSSKMIIIQVWPDCRGVAVYSSAGLGHTFEELEKAL